MNSKTEWEVIDAPPQNPRQALWQWAKARLGVHWRWKVAGIATLAALALVLFVMLSGVVILLVVTAATVSFAVSKLRQWLRGRAGNRGHNVRIYTPGDRR